MAQSAIMSHVGAIFLSCLGVITINRVALTHFLFCDDTIDALPDFPVIDQPPSALVGSSAVVGSRSVAPRVVTCLAF